MRDRDSAGDCLFRLPNLTIKTLQIRQPGKNPAADEATLSDPITGRRITRSFFPLQFIQDDRWFFLYSRRVRYGSGIGFCMTPFVRKNAVLATRGTSEDACASNGVLHPRNDNAVNSAILNNINQYAIGILNSKMRTVHRFRNEFQDNRYFQRLHTVVFGLRIINLHLENNSLA